MRQEDKSPWERRAPLSPAHVRQLLERTDVEVVVEPSPTRAFADAAYAEAGARVTADLSSCRTILGVKEIPPAKLAPGVTYLYFAHVIKGQPANMPMLQTLLDRGCSLIDYEKVTDDEGRRLIFFGRHAGLAGMIDTLWAFGQRWARRGVLTPLAAIRRAHEYADIDDAKRHIRQLGARLAREGIPSALQPLTIGLTGYGNVSQGAQEVLDMLPVGGITPADLAAGRFGSLPIDRSVIKVVFEEHHMFEPTDPGRVFDLQDYYDVPSRYRSRFDKLWPRLRVLVNCIYWDSPYPRLVTRRGLRERAAAGTLRLDVIGDISCDIEGAIEVTARPTTVDDPVFTYDPASDSIHRGLAGAGPVVMAIDNLPCELPADATRAFGDSLVDFIPALAEAHGPDGLDAERLPAGLRRALIAHRGELTADYRYLKRFL
jgi:alpha-aminoadipic semialdehyde synthase